MGPESVELTGIRVPRSQLKDRDTPDKFLRWKISSMDREARELEVHVFLKFDGRSSLVSGLRGVEWKSTTRLRESMYPNFLHTGPAYWC